LKKVSGGLEVCANASKHVFNHSRRSIIYFFEKTFLVVWKYAQMHQNTFLPLQMLKNIFFKDMMLVVWKYAKMHQNTILTTSDGQKYLF
jgi:hypothetical protein